MSKFETVRFGELQYDDADVIHLPEGLVGMPNLRSWLILEMGDTMPMKWFQSLDRGDFGFPVTQPDLYVDAYEIQVTEATRKRLGNREIEELVTLVITTVHPGGQQVTGNLLAPLLIDTNTRRGVQLTQDDQQYSVRQEINYFKFGLAVQSESEDNGASGSGNASEDGDRSGESSAQTNESEGVTC